MINQYTSLHQNFHTFREDNNTPIQLSLPVTGQYPYKIMTKSLYNHPEIFLLKIPVGPKPSWKQIKYTKTKQKQNKKKKTNSPKNNNNTHVYVLLLY